MGACPDAAGDLDELRLCPKGDLTLPQERGRVGTPPHRARGGSLPSKLQQELPVLSFSACFELLFSPFHPRRRSVLCPPAPRGPPLPPSLLPLALRAGAGSHTHPCDSMGCQESSVWHVLGWRWEQADSSTQRVVTAPAALPLLSTKLSPQQPIQKLLFGVSLALLGLPGPGGAAVRQVLP